MMDVLARFERGPLEEIRVCLVRQKRRTALEMRVYAKPMAGRGDPFPSAEGITLPLELFDTLYGALKAVDETLRRQGVLPPDRKLRPFETGEITQMVGGEPTVITTPRPPAESEGVVTWQIRHLGRGDARLTLECPLEYTLRGKQPGEPKGGRMQGHTKDISRTGVQVVLRERIPVLTMLHVTMHLPVGDVSLPCEVVWAQRAAPAEIARQGCRHGLRYTAVTPRDAQLIEQLFKQAQGRSGAAPA